MKKIKQNIAFKKELESSSVMIQFDNDEPQSVMKLLNGKSKVSFELSNTDFSSIEFIDEKTKKRMKIFIDKK